MKYSLLKKTILAISLMLASVVSFAAWHKTPNVAQYKWASAGPVWENEVIRLRVSTPEEANEDCR